MNTPPPAARVPATRRVVSPDGCAREWNTKSIVQRANLGSWWFVVAKRVLRPHAPDFV